MTTLALNRSIPAQQSFSDTLKAASQQPAKFNPAPEPALLRGWRWLQAKLQGRTLPKPLQLTGTLALGEKRTIFVVEVSGRKFLVGGTPTNLVMLSDLGAVNALPEPARLTDGATPEVKKEPRRRTRSAAPQTTTQAATHRAAMPVAAKTVSSPRRPRRKAEPQPVAI